jgi:hypothetical protein
MIVRSTTAFAILIAASFLGSSGAKAERLMDPDLPFCTAPSGGGSPWCGYRTMEQCEESASGTGHECIVNSWTNASDDGGLLNSDAMASVPRPMRKHH